MEALGLGPRPLFDVSRQGSCMLNKAASYFSGLDPFAWAGASSVQCEYWVSPSVCKTAAHCVFVYVCTYMCVCVCVLSVLVLLSLSPLYRKSQIPFDYVYPFSPRSVFVYVLSVLCERECGSVFIHHAVCFLHEWLHLIDSSSKQQLRPTGVSRKHQRPNRNLQNENHLLSIWQKLVQKR